MKKKYLPLYYEWKRHDRDFKYLCHYFSEEDDKIFRLMIPTPADKNTLLSEGLPICAWGAGNMRKKMADYRRGKEFSPLRQNIVLFMCAMNGEL